MAYHSLDVAAVGHVLLTRRGAFAALGELLETDRDRAVDLLCFLLSLHDLGKFSMPFQAKAPVCSPFERQCKISDPGHGRAAFSFWLEAADETLLSRLSGDPVAIDPLAVAVFGHHGKPVTEPNLEPRSLFGPEGLAAAAGFMQAMADLHLGEGLAFDVREAQAKRASFALAGFAVLCDWIGSKQTWFPYTAPGPTLAEYWPLALERAERAVDEAGVVPARPRPVSGYGDLLGKASFAPRPMQAWAESVAISDGPALFLIEDDTGSGKTEAALMLAHRLMVAGRAQGLYVALPTMATANAMFDRLEEAYRNLFLATETPSLALAHSASDLHPGFRRADLKAGAREPGYDGSSASDQVEDVTATAACADWIADDRRRAFLADVGVGTIDQALLAILPSKFQSLRLLGLSQRVLILDEIHAYDAYMQEEIRALLRFQAALGGSAVLLSATLPNSLRGRFTCAFQCGLDERSAGEASREGVKAYPLASVVASGVTAQTPVAASRQRKVPVRFLDSPDAALMAVEQAAAEGRAALYIRNAVDDAIEAARAFAARGLEPMLFHARFALCDRLEREKRVLATFGRDSQPSVRAGKVLVSTQLTQESLDIDFDFMASDIAPVDLLIQRAGRLWRHERARPPGSCELLLVTPDPVASADKEWPRRLLRRTAAVYGNHAQLWLTAKVLKDAGAIASPDGLRRLVEAVYSESADEVAPEGLLRSSLDAEGRDSGDRSVAQQNILKLEVGYISTGGSWDEDASTPTRLEEDKYVTLRLARLEGDRIRPWAPAAPDAEPWRAWRLSECRVRKRWIAGEASWPSDLAPLVAAAKGEWSRFDGDKILVVLTESGEGWQGAAKGPNGERCISYDLSHGLQLDRSK
ncbi:MAG: CRISPR-associated helicase Cas3' [Kiloniellales bacterium]|nr:CRISPR-associated helicase Cas3' [Kiloniellales bacterium]